MSRVFIAFCPFKCAICIQDSCVVFHANFPTPFTRWVRGVARVFIAFCHFKCASVCRKSNK